MSNPDESEDSFRGFQGVVVIAVIAFALLIVIVAIVRSRPTSDNDSSQNSGSIVLRTFEPGRVEGADNIAEDAGTEDGGESDDADLDDELGEPTGAEDGGNEDESETEEEHGGLYPLLPFSKAYAVASGDVTAVFAAVPEENLKGTSCADDPDLPMLLAVLTTSGGLLADLPTLNVMYVGELEVSPGRNGDVVSRGLSMTVYEIMAWGDCYCGKTSTKPVQAPIFEPRPAIYWQDVVGEEIPPQPMLPTQCDSSGLCPWPKGPSHPNFIRWQHDLQ